MGSYCSEECMTGLAMVVLQFIYAAMALTAKAALTQGLSPRVFIVYRQAIATLVLAPATIIARRGRRTSQLALGMKSYCLMFVASLIGVTISQNFYYQGLHLSSPSIATAMTNLVPAITFLMAASIGLEKVEIRSLRTLSKVFGTIICVGGAISIALFKGPKLLHMEFETPTSILHSLGEDWMIGCLFLLGCSCCWSFWLVIQVPLYKFYPDLISLSAWMCFLSALQSAILTFFLEPDLRAWKLTSSLEFLSCLYAGIVGSGITFCVQSWCISRRGPLFSAMFNPLCTVITTILAFLLLHEELYLGSLVGAAAVVGGVYAVLWGKAMDLDTKKDPNPRDESTEISISIDDQWSGCQADMKEPLLTERSEDAESR